MNRQLTTKRFVLIATPVLVSLPLFLAGCSPTAQENVKANVAPASAAAAESTSTIDKNAEKAVVSFNDQGELERPTGYRKWIYVGTPLTPNDMNNGTAPFPEFHNVYMNPAAFNQYESTGEFPDGTVIIKELVSVGDKAATSGKGYFMGEFIGLEVSIKDKARFKEEPGNWAYFSFGHEYPLKEMAKPQPAASCNECHEGNAGNDWVFTQYYPILRAVKKSE